MTASRTQPSRQDVLGIVVGIVAEQMGLDPAKIRESDLLTEDLGCDSLDLAEIAMEIEEQLQISVPDEFNEELKAIGDVTDGIMQLLGQGAS